MREKVIGGWFFWGLFLLFLWPLLLLQKSFILNDFSAQHLPWAKHYFESLRGGGWPLWTQTMTNGFPLFAEGQMGALYIPTILSFIFLPFLAAYTWSIPFHMAIGGLGMYGYAKRIGLSRDSAWFSALIFVFGSGYAGCFYNTASLRTLCWMPLALFMIEYISTATKRQRALAIATLAILFSQQWAAGFSQMAVYAFGYSILYALGVGFEIGATTAQKIKKMTTVALLTALAVFWATALSLLQIIPTLQLISESVRSGESISFALWGSVPPIAATSLLFPEWGNALRVSFYVGAAPLLCFLFIRFGQEARVKTHLILAILFFLLALGKFNPAYKVFLEIFNVTFLRNPSKFLFFSVVSLSVLAGHGFDRWISLAGSTGFKKQLRGMLAVVAFVCLAPLIAASLLRLGSIFWEKYSRWYIQRLIAEKGVGAKDFSYYMDIMQGFFDRLPSLFSYLNNMNLLVIGLFLAAGSIIVLYLFGRIGRRLATALFFAVLVVDLYIFGLFLGAGFIGNAGPVKKLEFSESQKILSKRLKEPLQDIFIEYSEDRRHEVFSPNFQMYYGFSQAGGYSPLLLKKYYELTHDLGIVDSSTGADPFLKNTWGRERALLDALGVRWVYADTSLDFLNMDLADQSAGHFLYENKKALPFVTGFYRWQVMPEKNKRLSFLKSEEFNPEVEIVLSKNLERVNSFSQREGRISGDVLVKEAAGYKLRLVTDQAAVAMLRLAAYPGWRIVVDGKEVEWFEVNHAFIGFFVEKGEHEISAVYQPTHWPALLGWTAISWMATLCFVGVFLRARPVSKC